MVICLERDADLHMAQLMPLPLTVSCCSKFRLVLPFWYRLTWVVPDKGLLNGCVCVCVCVYFVLCWLLANKLVRALSLLVVRLNRLNKLWENHNLPYLIALTIDLYSSFYSHSSCDINEQDITRGGEMICPPLMAV